MRGSFVRLTRVGVWHIERKDGHTACGLPSTPRSGVVTIFSGGKMNLCKSCDRMADSMKGALAGSFLR
jgi:hypothetical protein